MAWKILVPATAIEVVMAGVVDDELHDRCLGGGGGEAVGIAGGTMLVAAAVAEQDRAADVAHLRQAVETVAVRGARRAGTESSGATCRPCW